MFKLLTDFFKKAQPVKTVETVDYKYKLSEPRCEPDDTTLTKDEKIDKAIYTKLLRVLNKYPPHEWTQSMKNAFVWIHPTCSVQVSDYTAIWLHNVAPITEKGRTYAEKLSSYFWEERAMFKNMKQKKLEDDLIDEFLKKDEY